MKIVSFKFNNNFQEWAFDEIHFFDLTLLVGISGVGKTQILRSINTLKSIAQGESFNGVAWDVTFITREGNEYNWKGEFNKIIQKNDLYDLIGFNIGEEVNEEKPKILHESIFKDGVQLINRDEANFFFEDKEMPKLAPYESAIYILKEENLIKSAHLSFEKIVFRDHTEKEGRISFRSWPIKKMKEKYVSIEEIKESNFDTIIKLALVYENARDVFNQIKQTFTEVFEQVEDLKVESVRDEDLALHFEAPIIQIKEKGVEKWIPQNRISSGMLRTLMHISEMYLWSDGTVILIDEFENSLGVNCINVLTEDLIFRNVKLQFIVTSHHPYIISKIPYEYWKIVTRRGGVIKTYDAKDFDLGEDSHHDRFMNLINLPVYKDGTEF